MSKTDAKTPPQELPTEGHVRTALDDLAQAPTRDNATGRFVPGNIAAGKTLARSAHFWDAVGAAKLELVERLRADLAVDDGNGAETMIGLIHAYSEVRLFRHAMFVRLVELGGPITTKGKARALYTSYLSSLDREIRLAQVLGLERRAATVPTLVEWMKDRTAPKGGDDA